ncbi:TetR family transcriptional regulator [Allosaccharopolyspora coralli]|uniref:TetR family transcriptional regulator n=1 Tax=Allosaccharopolyspora coralli TaxID=2665642 RepID=A0A5Q3Q9X2_9PSEU|nr:TetR/AcrR family transcriptional regulator [Allosaccharopolyspora coralli]QGK69994.1 TetR family transcriptional regulator [Allosaccharopolyspora coralli]
MTADSHPRSGNAPGAPAAPAPPAGRSGDPERALRVLWRTDERASRKNKPELHVDRIVGTGIALADAHGLDALSMRRVATELGVGTMSLYTYVPGKDELLEAMLDAAYAETAGPERADGGWRAHLEDVARENLALYQRHPWVLRLVTGRPVLGPGELAKYDHEIRGLDGIGLTDVEMDAVLTLVLGHVQSVARVDLDARQSVTSSGESDAQWWDARAPLLETFFDSARYPVAARVGQAVGEAHGAAQSAAYAFEFGLHRILDGVETLLHSRR